MFQKMLQGGGGEVEPIIDISNVALIGWENSASARSFTIPQGTKMVMLISNDTSGSVDLYNSISTDIVDAEKKKTDYKVICILTNTEKGGTLTVSGYTNSGTIYIYT